jgi:hypothetical protein
MQFETWRRRSSRATWLGASVSAIYCWQAVVYRSLDRQPAEITAADDRLAGTGIRPTTASRRLM